MLVLVSVKCSTLMHYNEVTQAVDTQYEADDANNVRSLFHNFFVSETSKVSLKRNVPVFFSATEQCNRIRNNSLRQCSRNVYWRSNHITNQLAMLVSELEGNHNQKGWPSFSGLELNSLASPVTVREQRCVRLPVSNRE